MIDTLFFGGIAAAVIALNGCNFCDGACRHRRVRGVQGAV